jgi:5-methylcytosine-specific restriction protein A
VGIPDVTAADIFGALDEFDELGRAAFLTKYRFGEARSYFLRRNDRDYDSKAVVGAAHTRRHGEPLEAADFSGGEATVKRLLEQG